MKVVMDEWIAYKKEIQNEIMINEDIASHYLRSIYIIKDLNNQIKTLNETIQMHLENEEEF